MPREEQNAIKFTFQSLDPRAQSRRGPNSETDEQMNVVWHDHVTPNTNAKVGCAPTIFDEGLVHFGRGEQTRTSMRVERYEINRRIGALRNQIQSRRLIFEQTLHSARLYPAVNPALKLECCSVRCPQRSRSFHEGTPLRTADSTAKRLRWGQRTLHSKDRQERVNLANVRK